MSPTRIWGSLGNARGEIPSDLSVCAHSPSFRAETECFLGYSKWSEIRPPVATSPYTPNLKIVGDVSLYDRADLSASLGCALPNAPGADPELILAAYARWGSQCSLHLEGEFSFAIWDEKAEVLFLCQDHTGSRPLYYWHNSPAFLFASDPRVLLQFPSVPRELNRRKLAALAVPNGWEFHDTETLHRGIFSLSPGTSMTVSREGLKHQTYWVPAIHSELVPKRDHEAFEKGRDLLFAAVRNRIADKETVAATLSGGLDSSALAAIAARCLAEKNRELLTFSSVLPQDHASGLTDERAYIDEFKSWPNIRMRYVTAPGRGPFEFLDHPSEFEAAFGASSRRYLDAALAESASAAGADIALSGAYGELGPTTTGHGHYLDLCLGGSWVTLARELKAFSLVRGGNLRPLQSVRMVAGQLLDLVKPTRVWGRPFWFHMTGAFERECEAVNPIERGWKRQGVRQLEQLQMFLRRHATRHLTIAPAAAGMSFPLLDRRLLEYCLAVPGDMKVRDGHSRYFIRRTMEGILPPKVQWRTGKMPFSPDYFERFNAQLPMARAFLSAIKANDPVRTIVDVDSLRDLLKPLDPLTTHREVRDVPRSLYVICFLRQFPEFRS